MHLAEERLRALLTAVEPEAVYVSYHLWHHLVVCRVSSASSLEDSALPGDCLLTLVRNWKQVSASWFADSAAIMSAEKMYRNLQNLRKATDADRLDFVSRHVVDEVHAIILDVMIRQQRRQRSAGRTVGIFAWLLRSGRVDVTEHFPALLNLLVEVDEGGGSSRAVSLFRRVQDATTETGHRPLVTIDVRAHNAILRAFAMEGKGEEAEDWLVNMTEQVEPDSESWRWVLSAWVQSSAKGGEACKERAADRADRILTMLLMKRCQRRRFLPHSFPAVPLPTFYCNAVLSCHVQARRWNDAYGLFQDMRRSSSGDDGDGNDDDSDALLPGPDTYSHCLAIHALARLGRPAEAERLFDTILTRPVNWTRQDDEAGFRPYTLHSLLGSILQGWLTLSQPDHAVVVLHRMKDLREQGVLPQGPNERHYNAIVRGYVNSTADPRQSAEKGEKLLLELKSLPRATEDQVAALTIQTYARVISAWLQCEGGEARGKELLKEALEQCSGKEALIKPNEIYFHHIVDQFCAKNMPDEAEKLLLKVCNLCSKETISPKARLKRFASVLRTWMRSNNPSRARLLLEKIKVLQDSGMLIEGFDLRGIWSELLRGLSQARTEEGAQQAYWLLRELRDGDNGFQPTFGHFNQVIHAFAESSRPDLAENVLREMRHELKSVDAPLKPNRASHGN
jgi:pentatricopeptide repeat protein